MQQFFPATGVQFPISIHPQSDKIFLFVFLAPIISNPQRNFQRAVAETSHATPVVGRL